MGHYFFKIFSHIFSLFLKLKEILVTSKEDMERKSECFCCLTFFWLFLELSEKTAYEQKFCFLASGFLCTKNPLARKQIFVHTPFSHSTKNGAKKVTPQNHSLFRSTSCFGVTKIATPIYFQKSRKCLNRS